MKRTLLTMALALAMFSGAKAQTVLPLLPSAHGLTTNQPAYNAGQTYTLTEGWNWWSTGMNLGSNSTTTLREALTTNASVIKSQTNSTYYEEGIWGGEISEIVNTQMYMIKMTNDASFTLSGECPAQNNIQITAQNGWTWISYPCTDNKSVNTALASYTGGGVIKSQDGSSYYDEQTEEWVGSLASMTPGLGYKLYNSTGAAVSFTYPAVARDYEKTEAPLATNWDVNYQNFATNMTMLATAKLFGENVEGDNYEIGAFAGNECRGSIRLMQVKGREPYYAFLTIMGNDSESIQFRLLNHETSEVFVANNRQTYSTDAIVGSLNEPYILNFNTLMSNDEFMAGKMDMFPNPVKRDGMLTLSIPALSKNMKVQVINSLGMVVKSENMSAEKANLSVNLAPGVYTVKVVAGDKQLYVEKLIVE